MSLSASPTPSDLRNFSRKSYSFYASACSFSSSGFISRSWSIVSLRFIILNYASLEVGARDELCLDRKLLSSKIQRLTRESFINTLNFVHYAARLDYLNPVIRRSLIRSHTRFGRLFGDLLIAKYHDPDLAAAFYVTRQRDNFSLDPPVG